MTRYAYFESPAQSTILSVRIDDYTGVESVQSTLRRLNEAAGTADATRGRWGGIVLR
jgi:hypothetical protein